MNTPEKCPRCGSGPYGGTSHYSSFECRTILWDDGTLRLESQQCRINQLTGKLAALESAYAECAEKLYRAEQREHDLKRRLKDMRGQRDRLATELRQADNRAEERVRKLEADNQELLQTLQLASTHVEFFTSTPKGSLADDARNALLSKTGAVISKHKSQP